ncbi:MAG: 30S ribosomal protein S16 [Alphaproteobacteria bacterium]|nr:MAG: 30S ribosomal protein S16 [Alphaproteobacteria bacterium]
MALKIRLSRGGAKKRPFYRVVVADVRSPRDGRYIEKLGTFNPLLAKDSGERFNVDLERVQYWLSKGAKPTDKVARFLSENDLYKWERSNNPNKGKPGLKAQERLEEQAQKEAEAKEAAEAAAAAEAEAAAAPAEEAPAEEAAEEEKAAE